MFPMKHHTPAVTHPAHDRLLELKLKGANHLARVLDSDAPEPTKLKAAAALARLAVPSSPSLKDGAGGRVVDARAQSEMPNDVASPGATAPSLSERAGGRAAGQPEPADTPMPAASTQTAAHSPSQPRPQPSQPHVAARSPRPEIFNAPAKPLATGCLERLGTKFP